jgi:hypothetical protein
MNGSISQTNGLFYPLIFSLFLQDIRDPSMNEVVLEGHSFNEIIVFFLFKIPGQAPGPDGINQ